jgi:hypothetical protein
MRKLPPGTVAIERLGLVTEPEDEPLMAKIAACEFAAPPVKLRVIFVTALTVFASGRSIPKSLGPFEPTESTERVLSSRSPLAMKAAGAASNQLGITSVLVCEEPLA